MHTLVLSNNDLVMQVERVLDMLFEDGKSFTAHNITEIIRSTGVFYKHETTKEVLKRYILPVNYRTMLISVNNEDVIVNAILYTNFTLNLNKDTVISSGLDDFKDIVDSYKEWFNELYTFTLPEY